MMSGFALLSATGEAVGITLDPAITSQSMWLQAAAGIGEEEGVVPVASTSTLRCLVAYMQHYAVHREEHQQEVELPISCTCSTSAAGLGYDVRAILSPCDIAFLDNCVGPGETWGLESQDLLLELMVAADFVGHSHLSKACAAYLCCRLMSATEPEILGWFGKGTEGDRGNSDLVWDGGEGEGMLLLRDEARLHVLEEMKKIIDIEE
ncbi:hypothetical protein DQ04_08981020 [Trypanosoma grayi]|uniref:hypothetical protein n=1 Tax=Trypanosoma grayi TaxID=71804 RepID=UPI0004F42083|nr:hypothetical protein DQ04_08981020 [Trypanosoma grayi]KEG07724.1 hypothetical protein DQ04_08981020 [Trypanosoma grayi]